jgi:hypothetical protein
MCLSYDQLCALPPIHTYTYININKYTYAYIYMYIKTYIATSM